MDFMGRVNALKSARGKSNYEIAKEAGIPYATIDALNRRGHQGVRLQTVVKLAEYFNVSLDWLVYGSEEVNMERGRLIDVAKLALECADAMQEMAGMTKELGRVLIELSKQTDERKEGTP